MKRWKQWLITVCVLLAFTGCSSSRQKEDLPEIPEDISVMEAARVYPIEIVPGYLWLTDRNGKTVQPVDSTDFLFDLLTDEPVYRIRTRRSLTGKKDEYGQPVYSNTMKLSSINDETIRDWDDVIYESAFNDYIICRDYADEFDSMMELPEDYHTALIDGGNGKVIQNHVCQVKVLGEDRLLALDKDRYLMGILDTEGQWIVKVQPERKIKDPEAVRGKILGQENNRSVILDDQLETVYSAERINALYKGLHGPYFIEPADQMKIMDWNTLTEAAHLKEGEELAYFDGELMICYEEQQGMMIMEDCEGNRILTAELILNAQSKEDREPAELFLTMDQDTVSLLSREGEKLLSAEIPGLCGVYCDREGIYYYEVQDSNDRIRMGILDEELKVLVPAVEYETISSAVLQDERVVPVDYYLAIRNEDQQTKTDILDEQGQIIFSGADRICLCGLDRFALVRDNQAGLIDGKGNWIVCREIYNKKEDRK